MTKIYCFDLDQTLCQTSGEDYNSATPFWNRIATVNELFLQGNVIKILTARGSKTGLDWRTLTERQLKDWGLLFHELHFGKPFADFYIDDKAVSDRDFFDN